VIDRILCVRSNQDIFSNHYTADQAVEGMSLVNAEAEELVVVLPPWHGGGNVTSTLVRRLSQERAVLNLNLHDQILEPNIDRVLQSLRQVKDRAHEELEALQDEFNYQTFHLVAISLGNVAASLLARAFGNFSTATLVMPASDLAASMWDGQRTQNIRRSFEEQGIKKDDLIEAWEELAPKNYATDFKHNGVTVYTSKPDKIIPYYYQRKMVDSLEAVGNEPMVKSSGVGHAATIIRFCMAGSKI
jgi:hypothetical protein